MQTPILTHHAYERSQQRGIPPEILSAILRKGLRTRTRDTVIYRLNKGRATRLDGQRFTLTLVLDPTQSCIITLWKEPPQKRPTHKARPQNTYQRVHWPQNQLLGQFSPEDWEDELVA